MRELKVAGTMQLLFFFVLGFYFLATTFAVSQTAMFYIFVESCVIGYIYLLFSHQPNRNQIVLKWGSNVSATYSHRRRNRGGHRGHVPPHAS